MKYRNSLACGSISNTAYKLHKGTDDFLLNQQESAEMHAIIWSNGLKKTFRKNDHSKPYVIGNEDPNYEKNVPYSVFLRKLAKTIKKNISEQDPQRRISLMEFNTYFDWMSSSSGWRVIRDKTHHAREFFTFFFEITEFIEKLEFKNRAFLGHLLLLASDMCDDSEVNVGGRHGFFTEFHLITLSARQCDEDSLVLQNLFEMPYNTKNLSQYRKVNVVMDAAFSGNIGLLKILLRFGVTMLPPRDCHEEWEYASRVLALLLHIQNPSSSIFFERDLWHFLSQTAIRRLFLLIRVLNVLVKIHQQPQHAESYIRSLELLFESIPEPIITTTEIKKRLKQVYGKCVKIEFLLSVCKMFELHFPQSCQPPQPRSLQHLSRCQVRDNLRARKSYFSNEVNALTLPKRIKDYILLKDGNRPTPNQIMHISQFSYIFRLENFSMMEISFNFLRNFRYGHMISCRSDYVLSSVPVHWY